MSRLQATKAIRHALNIGLPIGASILQASQIMVSHSGCVAHFSSNLFEIFLILVFPVLPWRVRKIGSWSKKDTCKWHTIACGNVSPQSNVAHCLSSRSWTKASLGHPLHHVKIFPLYPRSISPHCSSVLQKSSLSLGDFGIWSCFSNEFRISLKSPRHTHSTESREFNCFKKIQDSCLHRSSGLP